MSVLLKGVETCLVSGFYEFHVS